MGWNRMGAGASLFFKNEGPLFLAFFLLISILLNVLSRAPSSYEYNKYKITNVNFFFLLQPGLLHAQQDERGDGVVLYAVAEGHRPLQLFTLS